jgi:hypothetical protein
VVTHAREEEAALICRTVHEALDRPFEVSPSLMRGSQIQFPSIVSACYFQGRLNGSELGLRKPAIGRQLDLIRCLSSGRVAREQPEQAALLIAEVLLAPWYYESRGRVGEVASDGFYQYLYRLRRSGYFRQLYMTVRFFADSVIAFAKDRQAVLLNAALPTATDLLLNEVKELAGSTSGDVIPIQDLVQRLIHRFDLQPTATVDKVLHGPTGEEVVNSLSSAGFENDIAKRLMELAALKRLIIPVHGVPVMSILVSRTGPAGQRIFQRVLCQGFRLNPEPSTYQSIIQV